MDAKDSLLCLANEKPWPLWVTESINSVSNKCFAVLWFYLSFSSSFFSMTLGNFKCPNSKWFSLKCHKEGAWIFPWAEIFVPWSTNRLLAPFSPGLQGFRTYKWFEKCGSVLSVWHSSTPSTKITVANRNLLSSIIWILTFIPLWRSRLEMISDFLFPFPSITSAMLLCTGKH